MPSKAPHGKGLRLVDKHLSHPATEYLDFELRAWRPDFERIEVVVQPTIEFSKQQRRVQAAKCTKDPHRLHIHLSLAALPVIVWTNAARSESCLHPT